MAMTWEEREKIFAKEYLDRQDIAKLFGFNSLSNASTLLTKIKYKVGDRLGIEGKIHIEDYLAYFGIKSDRYIQPIQDNTQKEGVSDV